MRFHNKTTTFLTLAALFGAATGLAQTEKKAAKPEKVSLTIYNQNFALVKERRSIDLIDGRNLLVIEDVAALIDPTSVHFKSITDPTSVVVREQNYRYDLINPTTLLNKSVGKKVRIRQNLGNGNQREIVGTIVNPVTATVANTGDGGGGSGTVYNGMVIRTEDGQLLLNPVGEIALVEMPAGLIPIPQLAWAVDSTRAGKHSVEVSYMTQGVTWKADYVCVLSADDKFVDVTGWVTLDNKSGTTYENAGLQLVAGDVRRIQPPVRRPMAPGGSGGLMRKEASNQFQEESLFEYHLYSLDGTTTVRQNEQKQMTLLNANKAPANKKFIFDGRKQFYQSMGTGYLPGEGYDSNQYKKVNTLLEIKNDKPAMGIPLPKGKMRLYKADSKGSLQFVGEDEIDHTPQGETVRLYVGDAFDLVGEHKRTDFKRLSKTEVEESFEISVRNRSKEDRVINVVEHLWQDWRVTSKSLDFVKKDASTIEFAVKVPTNGEVIVKYTVRTKYPG